MNRAALRVLSSIAVALGLSPCPPLARPIHDLDRVDRWVTVVVNQELFGGPTALPWGLYIDPQYRPPGYTQFSTFHPTFLYELIFDLAWAGGLVWLGHHRDVRPPGLFALYVTGYSAFRIFEESLRVDYSQHFLGLRLNFFVASALTLVGLAWFLGIQRGNLPGRRPPEHDGPISEVRDTGDTHTPPRPSR
ncbi:MAG: prolipoprotein diacylglyceryl transferase family protein [Pseudonocardiaceae bacterium]